MSWYQRNKEKEQKRMKEYRSTPEFKVHRLQKDRENRERINELKRKWRNGEGKIKDKTSKKKSDLKYYSKVKNNEEFKKKKYQRAKKYYQNNREKILEYSKNHAQIPEVKARRNEMARLRRKSNPQSNRRGSIDLQIAMNNVRKRDHNTCQWQGCGRTFRETPIHVHHIFPVSEYPDYELIEQYMICYCANHHGLWHRFRGDKYSEMIPARYQEDQLTTLRGRN